MPAPRDQAIDPASMLCGSARVRLAEEVALGRVDREGVRPAPGGLSGQAVDQEGRERHQQGGSHCRTNAG